MMADKLLNPETKIKMTKMLLHYDLTSRQKTIEISFKDSNFAFVFGYQHVSSLDFNRLFGAETTMSSVDRFKNAIHNGT